jgi:hypothetical protein
LNSHNCRQILLGSQQLWDTGIIISILQIRKVRFITVTSFVQGSYWVLFYLLFIYFHNVRVGVWTQGLTLAKQVFYHLSTLPALFCVWYFWNRVDYCVHL